MPACLNVVLVDGSPSDLEQIVCAFRATGDTRFRLQARDLSDITTTSSTEHLDLAILSLEEAGLDGLHRLRGQYPELAIVVLAGETTTKQAILALRHGCLDILTRGEFQPEVLWHALSSAFRRQKNKNHQAANVADEHRRLASLRSTVGQVAHDFNNLFCTIIGFSELLLEDLQGHPECSDVDKIRSAGERGKQLIRELLTVAHNNAAEESHPSPGGPLNAVS